MAIVARLVKVSMPFNVLTAQQILSTITSTLMALAETKYGIVGADARSHVIGQALHTPDFDLSTPRTDRSLYFFPGNPGTAQIGTNVPIGAEEIGDITKYAKEHKFDLTIVSPEGPLALGIADRFDEEGLPIVAPSEQATKIESSKAWAIDVMREAKVPHPRSIICDTYEDSLKAIEMFAADGKDVVVKADGLTGGKGVEVTRGVDQPREAAYDFQINSKYGEAGKTVIIQERVEGEEISIIAFTDGKTVNFLPTARDHKRLNDNDEGPNTGGMGAFAPVDDISDLDRRVIEDTIFKPVLAEMEKRGAPFKGFLYGGLMKTANGFTVLEFNARLGDPETQVILPLIDGDIEPSLKAITEGNLGDHPVQIAPDRAATVIVTAVPGYPENPQKGAEIENLVSEDHDILIFHAGTKEILDEDGERKIVTNGGRVNSIVGLGQDLTEAIDNAYLGVEKYATFPDRHFRRDIAKSAKSSR